MALTSTPAVRSGPVPAHRRGARSWVRPRRRTTIAAILVGWLVLGTVLRGQSTLALAVPDTTPLHDWLTALRDWVDAHRLSSGPLSATVELIRGGVGGLTTVAQSLISQPSFDRPVPVVGWLGVVALATTAAYALTSARIAGLTAAGLTSLGLLGLWSQSMDTLALTLVAVVLAVLVGVPAGIYIGLSTRAARLAEPVLDVMQTMPAFVYLAPLTLFFLIGPPAATITTLIYAAPPVMRLTAHSIRATDPAAIEAARSAGASRWQLLRTVQLPLARRTIVVGINQTTMAALSMVMIAALIDAPGLGNTVLTALSALDVGHAFTAGLAIVAIAVVLDRATTAAAARVETRRADAAVTVRRRRQRLLALGVVTVVATYVSHTYYWAATFPGPARGGLLGGLVDDSVNAATEWARSHLGPATTLLTDTVTYGLINPLEALLSQSPWYVVATVLIGLSFATAGGRAALTTTLCLALLLATGVWAAALVTLTSVVVATAVVIGLGVAGGVWLARSPRVDHVVRPILDAAQVMPAFVYLAPCVGLFGATRLTAIIAAVVFATPVAVKIVSDGVRGVPVTAVEAARAAGSTTWQVITKVQLPLARRAVALAANQGLIYVLSVVVIGGLVGAGALGYLVVAGFSQTALYGKGLAAGAAIVLLGVLLDRTTQAASRGPAAPPSREETR